MAQPDKGNTGTPALKMEAANAAPLCGGSARVCRLQPRSIQLGALTGKDQVLGTRVDSVHRLVANERRELLIPLEVAQMTS